MNSVEKILSDSRLFLTPLKIENGLSYPSGLSLRNPTLGIYIEWWLYYEHASIDANGRPIWFISGSPLSGSHACSSVDCDGHTHEAVFNGEFRDVWESFGKLNEHYRDAKTDYFAFSLQQAIDILQGKVDPELLYKTHIRKQKAQIATYLHEFGKPIEPASII